MAKGAYVGVTVVVVFDGVYQACVANASSRARQSWESRSSPTSPFPRARGICAGPARVKHMTPPSVVSSVP